MENESYFVKFFSCLNNNSREYFWNNVSGCTDEYFFGKFLIPYSSNTENVKPIVYSSILGQLRFACYAIKLSKCLVLFSVSRCGRSR